jgi:cytoskeletal protein CcmA (bactofilin family)
VWKKNEPDTPEMPPHTPPPSPSRARSGELATIGPSISVQGNLTGEEDMLIQGRIEGEIVFKNHNVIVGNNGRVKADIHGRSIRIEGEVKGNLYGDEEVVIRASGQVQGNIVAPRVTLDNGSKFKGSIDMEPARARAKPPIGEAGTAASKPAGPGPELKPGRSTQGQLPADPPADPSS